MSAALPIGGIAARLVGGRKRKGDAENPTDPVRSYSWDIDDARAKPHRPIGDGSGGQGWAFTNALVKAFQALHLEQERTGYEGPFKIQATFLVAFEVLVGRLDFATGELLTDYRSVAEDSGKGYGTVIRMVECAEAHGFLCHVRRSQKVENAQGQAGPQRKQACNAYYFDCERRMKAEVYAVFWRKLVANAKRITATAVRAAATIKRAFNSVAQPAPRAAGKELAATLRSLETKLKPVWAAQSASPK